MSEEAALETIKLVDLSVYGHIEARIKGRAWKGGWRRDEKKGVYHLAEIKILIGMVAVFS